MPVLDAKPVSAKSLLALPARDWHEKSVYDSLYLVPTRRKHDSGWMCIAVVGIKGTKLEEIASGAADDLEWNVQCDRHEFRMDCEWPSGILHAWGHGLEFEVEGAYSSTTINVRKKCQS